MHMEVRGKLLESFLSSHIYEGPRDLTQVIRIMRYVLYLMNQSSCGSSTLVI